MLTQARLPPPPDHAMGAETLQAAAGCVPQLGPDMCSHQCRCWAGRQVLDILLCLNSQHTMESSSGMPKPWALLKGACAAH